MKPEEQYDFVNCNGEVKTLPASATLGDLIRAGVRVFIEPKDAPPPSSLEIYTHREK